MLAIGAALLGAESVKGIEIDEKAVAVAQANAELLDADVTFIIADIRTRLSRAVSAPATPSS